MVTHAYYFYWPNAGIGARRGRLLHVTILMFFAELESEKKVNLNSKHFTQTIALKWSQEVLIMTVQ